MKPPILILNPPDDPAFRSFAQVLIDQGISSVEDLERGLRIVYRRAVVHARELSAEPLVIWYVYRDGSWVNRRETGPPPRRQAARWGEQEANVGTSR